MLAELTSGTSTSNYSLPPLLPLHPQVVGQLLRDMGSLRTLSIAGRDLPEQLPFGPVALATCHICDVTFVTTSPIATYHTIWRSTGLDDLSALTCRGLGVQSGLTWLSAAGCNGIRARDWDGLDLPVLRDLSLAG